jgi:hypothetical protein
MRSLHFNRGWADLVIRTILFTLIFAFVLYGVVGPQTVLHRYAFLPGIPIYIWSIVVSVATWKDPATWKEPFWAKGWPFGISRPRWRTIGSWVTLTTSTLLVIVVLGSLQLGLLH